MNVDGEVSGFFSGFGGGELSPNLHEYLREIVVDPGLFARTAAPGAFTFEQLAEQGPYLPVPEDAAASGPAEYYGTYLDVREYVSEDPLTGRNVAPDDLISEFVARFDRTDMLICLAVLGHLSKPHLKLPGLVAWYREQLSPALRPSFDKAMGRSAPGLGRLIVARQPVLASIRAVLQAAPSPIEPERPSLATAIMMTHALGATLESTNAPGEEMLGKHRADQMMNVVCLGPLYLEDEPVSMIDRTLRLWRHFGSRRKRTKRHLRKEPCELLSEATGLELEDLLALGTNAWTRVAAMGIDTPILLEEYMGLGLPSEKIEKFLSIVASTPEEQHAALAGRTSHYDFLPLQEKPVLRLAGRLLVLDERYLLERVSSGLYYLVHDHERDVRGSDGDRRRWNNAYAEMVELFVEDWVHAMAPPLLGGDRERAFYPEEEFETAYDEGKIVDAAADFGSHFVIVEVVSGRLKVRTRAEGDVESFKDDTRRLVLKKCEQLDRACACVLEDPSKITGFPATPNLKAIPVLVVGGGYPSDPLSADYVRDEVAKRGLFADRMVEELAIINLGELEMLGGLAENGSDVPGLLVGWKRSDERDSSLRNYLIKRFGSNGDFRTKEMKDRIEEAAEDLQSRLLGGADTLEG